MAPSSPAPNYAPVSEMAKPNLSQPIKHMDARAHEYVGLTEIMSAATLHTRTILGNVM